MECNEKLGTGKERLLFLDIMKTIALVLMACIHTFNVISGFELYGESFPLKSLSTQMGFIYQIVPGVFMFCMGAGLVLTKKQTPKALAFRGLKLLLIGLILNIVRGFVYIILGVLADPSFYIQFWYWIWGSDILFFAGMYFLIFALFRKLNLGDIWIGVIAVAMLVVSHIIMPVKVENATLVQVFGNFVYVDEDSCFPLLSWTVFPTVGYLFMKYLLSATKKVRYILTVTLSSAFVLAVTVVTLILTDNMKSRYYLWGEEGFMMDILSALISLCVALTYAGIMYLITSKIKSNCFTSLIGKISARINTIYFIHWVFVMYMGLFWLIFSDYEAKNGYFVYIAGALIFAVSTLLSFVIKRDRLKK